MSSATEYGVLVEVKEVSETVVNVCGGPVVMDQQYLDDLCVSCRYQLCKTTSKRTFRDVMAIAFVWVGHCYYRFLVICRRPAPWPSLFSAHDAKIGLVAGGSNLESFLSAHM